MLPYIKTLVGIAFAVFVIGQSFGQTKKTTFVVCENLDEFPFTVAKSNYINAVEKRVGPGVEALSKKDYTLRACDYHPFMESLYHSYALHMPLILSPDMVWLLICQGFATHVNQNSDSLRDMIVSFEGKKLISIRRDDFVKGAPNNDWEGLFPEFSDSIKSYVGAELVESLTPQFTTTGLTEKAAFEITLMDAMQSYFKYEIFTKCGIPEITLEGTPEDWKLLRNRIDGLRKYHLDHWIDDLAPILDEFVNASKGQINAKFWREIYKMDDGSGGTYITGWIAKFFPYLIVHEELVLASSIRSRIETTHFTSGISVAPFIWDDNGTRYEMEFCAGFVGFQQIGKRKAVRPEIGWAIRDTGN